VFYKAILFITILVIGSSAFSADIFNNSEYEELTKRVDQQKEGINSAGNYPQNRTEAQIKAEQSAQQAHQIYSSKEFQGKIKQYTSLLSEQIQGVDNTSGKCSSANRMAPPGSGALDADERIYVFVSSSMPENTLKGYVSDIDKLRDPNIVLVMRGFIGGIKYFRPTLSFMTGLLKKDESCSFERGENCDVYQSQFQIDPMLFARYDITSVPAIVYARGLSINDTEASEGLTDNVQVGDAYVLYGDMSLEYALERFHRETNSDSILSAIKQLRKGFY
jgi:type-F conjugative transfer system pilin assembly protein TrbC